MEHFLFTPVLSALLVYLLDYGFGKPGDAQPNYRALLSAWPLYLAEKALRKANLWSCLHAQYVNQLDNATGAIDKANIRLSFRDIVFKQGQQLFTWQYAVGICPICTHFWVGLIFLLSENIFCQKENIFTFGLQLMIGHFFIRVLKKYF